MTIEEAEQNGCPKKVLDKLKRAGVSSISNPHISWEEVGKRADILYAKTHQKKTNIVLDSASEIYLWLFIEATGGFLWRMNHDLADGRIDSTPGIEKDLVMMQENIEYAASQLERFGIPGPSDDKYWEWYDVWKKHIEALSDSDYKKLNDMLVDNESNPCPEFSPYEPKEEMFFGKKLKKIRLEARLGLRKMSEKMDMLASEYSDIERGYVDYRKEHLITKIKLVLEGDVSKEDFMQLWDLYETPFIMQKMPEGGQIFHATKNIEGSGTVCLYSGEIIPKTRPATGEECVEISKWFNERAREHNQKADEFNNREI
jgi:hypothetical protein